MNAIDNVIRELAYELWENAGRPDGRGDEFWFAARFEFERREERGEIQVYPQSPFYEHDVVVRDGTGRAVRMTGATRRTGKRIGIDAGTRTPGARRGMQPSLARSAMSA